MTRQGQNRAEPPEPDVEPSSPFESGVISREIVDEMDADRAPPWAVMEAYLTTGEHRLWVEGWAARSPAFADVLTALRHDQDERASARTPRGAAPPSARSRR